MSLRKLISDFLDKSTAARFKTDGRGRLVFFPWGFGRGRIVPDADVEARLRHATRRMLIVMFTVVIPAISIIQGAYQLSGVKQIIYFVACFVLGFVVQIDLARLSRTLPRSEENLSYIGAMTYSLTGFSRRFHIFGLIVSLLFAATSAAMLAVPAIRLDGQWIAPVFSLLVFGPLSVVYARAICSRSTRRAVNQA